jgi:glycosyltransferase involved in cell wall biosynthesis
LPRRSRNLARQFPAGTARRFRDLATELGVAADVHFLGERTDVPQLLRALDVLLVPSWEDLFPRVVLEAMGDAAKEDVRSHRDMTRYTSQLLSLYHQLRDPRPRTSRYLG